MGYILFTAALCIFALILLIRVIRGWLFTSVTVTEYQRGLKYVKGRFLGVLEPGRYWIWKYSTDIQIVDMRMAAIAIPSQEVLTSDGMPLKISLAARYEISDPGLAINKLQNYYESFYLIMQVALREVISSATIEELLSKRTELGQKVQELASPQVEEFGLKLISATVKDIMLPGELKRIFTQVVKARQEGLAALERARGETAALRNLANAARLVEGSPALMQLRTLQSMNDGSGNTFVLGVPSTLTPVPVRSKEAGKRPNGDESAPEE